MDTFKHVEALRLRTAQLKAETESLKELWLTLFPADWLPSDRQFMVWLNLYDFGSVSYGIETAANRLNRKEIEAEETTNELIWNKSEAVKFASGVMKKQEERDKRSVAIGKALGDE